MHFRDKIFLAVGVVLVLFGSVASFFWRIETGIVALLLVSILILVFLSLLRRQVSKVQQRTLALLHIRSAVDMLSTDLRYSVIILLKNIMCLLQSQQMCMEDIRD